MHGVERVLKVGNRLGEGPLWSVDEGILYWVDIEGNRLYRFRPAARGAPEAPQPEAWNLGRLSRAFSSQAPSGPEKWLMQGTPPKSPKAPRRGVVFALRRVGTSDPWRPWTANGDAAGTGRSRFFSDQG